MSPAGPVGPGMPSAPLTPLLPFMLRVGRPGGPGKPGAPVQRHQGKDCKQNFTYITCNAVQHSTTLMVLMFTTSVIPKEIYPFKKKSTHLS